MSQERLLKWYEFRQSPDPMIPGQVIKTAPLPVPPNSVGQEVKLTKSIKLKEINNDDREELHATIVWSLRFKPPTVGLQIIIATQSIQFTIWRDAPFSGKKLCTVIDSGSLTGITNITSTSAIISNTFTTTLECTDHNLKKGSHKYFLTAAARNATGFTVSATNPGPPVPITTFQSPAISEVHFSGSVIDENDT